MVPEYVTAARCKPQTQRVMETYYRERAGEYDRIYTIKRWQPDLEWLRRWLAQVVSGRTVLEVAAGSGYWTQVAASTASKVTATDLHPELLARAGKRCTESEVSLLLADAFDLPIELGSFDIVMAHFWWSHVLKECRAAFLQQVAARLHPGGLLLMIDQNQVEGFGYPVSRWDAEGNRYEMRRIGGRGIYEIVKNFPDDAELRTSLAGIYNDLEIHRLQYLWALSARREN